MKFCRGLGRGSCLDSKLGNEGDDMSDRGESSEVSAATDERGKFERTAGTLEVTRGGVGKYGAVLISDSSSSSSSPIDDE